MILCRKYIWILVAFLIMLALLASSCKSKKNKSKKPKTTHISKKEQTATAKFPFKKTTNDNMQLYNIVEYWLETPHKKGGCSRKGIDCSCLVMIIYKKVYNIDLYRTSIDMLNNVYFVDKAQLKEADILFFKTGTNNKVSHVGLYLKDGYFVHTSRSKGVIISRLDEPYYIETFYKAGRHKNVK